MRCLLLVLLLGLAAVADEVHVGTGDEARLKVLRQRVRVAPSALAWEELALQLIALKRDDKGAKSEILKALRESHRRRPTAHNCYYLYIYTGSKGFLQQALELQPRSLNLYEAAVRVGLPSSPALREAAAYRKAYEAFRKPRLGVGFGNVTAQNVSWSDGVLKGPSWTVPLPLREARVEVAGHHAFVVTPDRVYVYSLADGRPVAEWPALLEFPESEDNWGMSQPDPVNLWAQSDALIDAGQHYMLLSGYWVMYVVDLRTGKGWAHFSGGDRTPQGELLLSPDEKYTLKYGHNIIECYRSGDGTRLWTYRPKELTTVNPLHFENGHAWLLEDYPGKVACLDLASGKILWYRALQEVIPR